MASELGLFAGFSTPATQDEKKLLKKTIVRKATHEECDAFMQVSASHLSDKAKTAFFQMSDEDKFRVMYEGPVTDCRDSTEVLYGRVQRFMDMERTLRTLAVSEAQESEEKPKEKRVSEIAMAVAQQLSTPLLEEVPEHERRCIPRAGAAEPLPESDSGQLVGTCKGVGGVIEALQKKYTMAKGQRLRVVGESKELWKLEDDKNVPKTHCNTGWKWVVRLAAPLPQRATAHASPEQPRGEGRAGARSPSRGRSPSKGQEKSPSRRRSASRAHARSFARRRSPPDKRERSTSRATARKHSRRGDLSGRQKGSSSRRRSTPRAKDPQSNGRDRSESSGPATRPSLGRPSASRSRSRRRDAAKPRKHNPKKRGRGKSPSPMPAKARSRSRRRDAAEPRKHARGGRRARGHSRSPTPAMASWASSGSGSRPEPRKRKPRRPQSPEPR